MNILPIKGFTFAHYEITLRVEERLRLPLYKGSALRGSFGETLKRLCCFQDPSTCNARPPLCTCPYGFIFSPKSPQQGNRYREGDEIARPFVIRPPIDARRDYQPQESLTFHLILFGKAIDYLPYFLVTFRELPLIGIAPHRGKVKLHEVWGIDEISGLKQRVYSAADQLVRNIDLTMSWEKLIHPALPSSLNRLTVHYQTNTILKYMGKEVRQIEFHILIGRLLQRVETLMGLYTDISPDFEAKRLINEAKDVAIFRDQTRWNRWTRYSSSQRQEISMDGVVGDITYAGNLAPFLPLLLLGQYTHVGKGCVFGLGQYLVEW